MTEYQTHATVQDLQDKPEAIEELRALAIKHDLQMFTTMLGRDGSMETRDRDGKVKISIGNLDDEEQS